MKFEPRRVARLIKLAARERLLTPKDSSTITERTAPTLPRQVVLPSHTATHRERQKEKFYAGRSTVRLAAGTFGESLKEKLLDAVEPPWFAKVDREAQLRDASAITKIILDRQRQRRGRKAPIAEPAARLPHPLYTAIESRLPVAPIPRPTPLSVEAIAPKVIEAARAEKDLRELLLFRGGLSLARVRSMFVFLSACKDAGIDNATDIVKASKLANRQGVSELAHFSGLHSPLQNLTLYGFLARIRQTRSVWPLSPGIGEWAGEVKGALKMRLEPIPYYADRNDRCRRPWRLKLPKPEPASFYPYLVAAPTDEYGLILRVHEAVPRGLPDELRADVCQELLVDILTGEMTLDDLNDAPRLATMIKEKLRLVRGKFALSLDEPLPKGHNSREEKDSRTWIDVLTSDTTHF